MGIFDFLFNRKKDNPEKKKGQDFAENPQNNNTDDGPAKEDDQFTSSIAFLKAIEHNWTDISTTELEAVSFVATQLIVDRDTNAAVINRVLYPFPGVINAAAIYSADLLLRNLRSLLELAKGLAPADPLVKEMNNIACDWPLSSVGIELERISNEEIIQHK